MIMKYFLFVISLSSFLSFGQENAMDTWIGHYEGIMYLEFPDKKKDQLLISLDIISIDSGKAWTQKFTYFSEKYGEIVKDYKLVRNESFTDNSHYFLDEQNGILIDEIMLNNTLFSHYQVDENFYQTRLSKTGDQLFFEIVCSKSAGGQESEIKEEDQNFKVKSTLIFTIQFATLNKV